MDEIWKDIPGWEGYYMASNLGRIKNIYFKNEKIKKQTKDKNGYLHVCFSKPGLQRNYLSHRLITKTFILNPDNKSEVNHKNSIRNDNIVGNLEWCTRSENILHSFRIGFKKHTENNIFVKNHPWKGKLGKDNVKSKSVYQFSKEGRFIREWGGIREIERGLGISSGHISDCCKYKRKTAGGFIWKYHT